MHLNMASRIVCSSVYEFVFINKSSLAVRVTHLASLGDVLKGRTQLRKEWSLTKSDTPC